MSSYALELLDKFYPVGARVEDAVYEEVTTPSARPESSFSGFGGYSGASYAISYTGEKNEGEAGPIKEYVIDHYALRARSWQLLLESEACAIAFNKLAIWTIGAGLRLQCNPLKAVLESEGIKFESGETERGGAKPGMTKGGIEGFNKLVEARFKIYSGNRMSDFTNMRSLNWQDFRAMWESCIGGDVLWVVRFVKGVPKVQLIDGDRLRTPLNFRGGGITMSGMGLDVVNPDTGNRIIHGVEIDAKGEHIAYWVQKSRGLTATLDALNYTRILARGSRSGALMAGLEYGNEYRLDGVRGLPLIAAVIETAKVMDRYKSATVGAAEERAKLPYFIEHGVTSTGENPQIKQYAKQQAGFLSGDQIPRDSAGKALANTVMATMNKMVYNMPVDSKISVPESRMELAFKDFYDTNFNYFCATLQIPPEVAMSMYNSNYSASRAAVKDWEHTLEVKRHFHSIQFKQPIYELWLDSEVLKGKVEAPGYIEALTSGNEMTMAAYKNARWEGDKVPSIDPMKEVQYWRAILGPNMAHVPLGTGEQAAEALTSSDFDSNVEQVARELEKVSDEGIESVAESALKQAQEEGGGDEEGTNGKRKPTPNDKAAEKKKKK